MITVLQARGFRFNLARSTVHVAYTVLLVILVLVRFIDPLTVVIASLVANVLTLLVTAFLLLRKGWLRARPALAEARGLLSFGSRVHVGALASIVGSRLDLVMLAAFVPAAELGNYAISAIPGSVLTLLPASASLVVYPAVVRMQPSAVPATVARCLAMFALITLLAFLVAIALPFAIPVLFGPGYQRAVPIGQILTFGITIRSNTTLLGVVLRGLSRPLASGLGDIVGLPILTVLLLVMVPTWQGTGAAVALLIAAGVGFVAMLVLCMRTVGITGLDVGRQWRRDATHFWSVIRSIWVAPAA
jgi:O-antigen/teichoic acid export membrane protein